MAQRSLSQTQAYALFEQALEQTCLVLIGKQQQVKLALSCLLANGHLLIEDLPGMGKTTLSHTLAKVLGLQYSRIQFTSDLLPADMLGINIFDNQSQNFQFHSGPIFSQLVLADEINRASPKTQSALLEAMEERQVSLDGVTRALPSPFFVIGTQNPMHQAGTYPLPESQLDRFLMRIQLGYPDNEAEKTMLRLQETQQSHVIQPVMNVDKFIDSQHFASQVHVSNALLDYIIRLVSFSRESQLFANPLSPRATKALLNSAKSWAFINHRDYVIPEDVQIILPAVAEHRLRSASSNLNSPGNLSQSLLESVNPLSS